MRDDEWEWAHNIIIRMVVRKHETAHKLGLPVPQWVKDRKGDQRRDPKYVLDNVVATEIGDRLWVSTNETPHGFAISSLHDANIIYLFGTEVECEKLMMQLIAMKEDA